MTETLARDNEVTRVALNELPCFLLYIGWRKAQALYRPLLGAQTPQRMYLFHLLQERQVMTVSSLAAAMDMEIAGASGLLSRMEKDGLVKRQCSGTNRLERLCSLTPQGEAIYDGLSHEIEVIDRKLLDQLTTDDLQALANVVMALKKLGSDPPPFGTASEGDD